MTGGSTRTTSYCCKCTRLKSHSPFQSHNLRRRIHKQRWWLKQERKKGKKKKICSRDWLCLFLFWEVQFCDHKKTFKLILIILVKSGSIFIKLYFFLLFAHFIVNNCCSINKIFNSVEFVCLFVFYFIF